MTFRRISTAFNPAKRNSDNAMISIYPFKNEMFAFTESPVMFRINPNSLETEEKVDLSATLGIINHTSHPHVTNDHSVNKRQICF